MIIKTQEEIDKIREGGHILAGIMDKLIEMVQPGVSTDELNEFAEAEMERLGGIPAFKGYKPDFAGSAFPTALCTSVNDEIVHTPANTGRVLRTGDILTIDVGFKYKGMYTDMARTMPVGEISQEAYELLITTQDALEAAIKALEVSDTLYAVGDAVEGVVQGKYGIIEDLVGHGVGKEIHEDPNIFNYRSESMKKVPLQKGMVIAIEPMLTVGSEQIILKEDDWTYATADGSLSAQFENTVAMNHDGTVEVLTPTKWKMI